MIRVALIASLLTLGSANAYAGVIATQHAEQEVITRDASGRETVSRVSADKVVPGEEVIYALRYVNESDEAADAVVLIMPVPPEVSYVEGSVAAENATVTFSADGGQTYVARGRLTIAEDGVERPARSNEITHIKWSLTRALAPREKGEVAYRAILK